jgi:hypothetical protein
MAGTGEIPVAATIHPQRSDWTSCPPDGHFAHARHAQIARRASLSQGDAVAKFGKSEA